MLSMTHKGFCVGEVKLCGIGGPFETFCRRGSRDLVGQRFSQPKAKEFQPYSLALWLTLMIPNRERGSKGVTRKDVCLTVSFHRGYHSYTNVTVIIWGIMRLLNRKQIHPVVIILNHPIDKFKYPLFVSNRQNARNLPDTFSDASGGGSREQPSQRVSNVQPV